jgi:hypothetical protein
MAQVVPAVARFELRYRNADNTMENVYYARTSSLTWSESQLDDVAAAFQSWESATAAPLRNDTTELYEIVATDLTSLFGIRKSYPVSPPIVGTLANPLPANVTVAVKASIGRRGRGTNGRTFWIGMAEGQTAGDSIATISANLIVAALNTIKTTIASMTPIEGLCIPHFVVDHVRPPSVQADIVADYLLSDYYLDSQRDRLPGHKKHKRFPIA